MSVHSTDDVIFFVTFSFTNDATLSWDAQRVHSSVKFSGKEAEISVNTPWRDVLGKYTVKGDMSSFTANTLMRWAADQQISADVTFDMQKDVTGSFTIKSPFYGKTLVILGVCKAFVY